MVEYLICVVSAASDDACTMDLFVRASISLALVEESLVPSEAERDVLPAI